MRKIVLLFFMIITFINSNFAQAIFSNGTGGGAWSGGSTWLGGVVPTSANDVFIAGTDSVYAEAAITCNNLSILSGGKFATSIDPIIVTNTTEVEADAYFYNLASSPNLPGSDIILDPASYVVHSGSGTVGSATNFEFGNLIIRRDQGVTAAANLIINGNLIVDMVGSAVFRGARPPTTVSQEHTVYGDVYIYSGILSCVDVGEASMYGIWNIEGNVYVYGSATSRISPFTSANAIGLGIFNINGDLIVDGGRFQAGNSSSAGLGTAIFNLGGNFTLTQNSAFSNTTHAGPFAINFVGNGTQTVTLRRNMAFGYPLSDTITAGSTVVFDLADSNWSSSVATGSFVVNGSLELMGNSKLAGLSDFFLNSGATLKIGSSDGISIADATGNIQVSGTRTFSPDANYEYKGTGTQELGDGLPNPVAGFAVNNPDSIVLRGTLTVTNSLNVINGNFDLNNNTIVLGPNATLHETPGNTIKGLLGKITITTPVVNPAALNVGGLGAVLTAGSDLGNTTVERFHSPAVGSGNQGILRRYNISPGQNNSGLNATLRLYYDDSESNGLNESGFQIYKSADGSNNSWSKIGGTVNTTGNYVEVTGVSDFSHWTIADVAHTLPVDYESDFIPIEFALHQNYPNPFNPETIIRFELPEESFVSLSVFNLIGEEVVNLVNEKLSPGVYSISFNGENLPSGLYLYKLAADNKLFIKKMMLLK